MKHTFAPYLKHLGKTPEEQMEKNKPLMTWLQQKMEEKVTEKEAEENSKNWEIVKEIIDNNRPSGQKLFTRG